MPSLQVLFFSPRKVDKTSMIVHKVFLFKIARVDSFNGFNTMTGMLRSLAKVRSASNENFLSLYGFWLFVELIIQYVQYILHFYKFRTISMIVSSPHSLEQEEPGKIKHSLNIYILLSKHLTHTLTLLYIK